MVKVSVRVTRTKMTTTTHDVDDSRTSLLAASFVTTREYWRMGMENVLIWMCEE